MQGASTEEEDSQFTYNFGWKQENHIAFLHKSTSVDLNPEEFITLLPPGLKGKKLALTVNICNEQNACKLVEAQVDVKPRDITTEELK